MKQIIEQYVRALMELLESGARVTDILKGLSGTLVHHGHEKIHAAILRELLHRMEHQSAHNAATVVVSSEAAHKEQREAIEATLHTLEADAHHVVVDESIVGGFAVTHRNLRLDRSYKSALVRLYRQIVSSTE